ncbi:hypothetical protein DMB66_26495 [Actinoplanes sp. ATCC 53533]|jgi:hypothetical protein|uniref:hypothetical protein n=1 Tax=Actinoplanes sp. ATCC 53533 TaxID=1288362 RepID=UPI000F7772C1|nr:hypothetical protein [Actinoplanes sp. ATCC 53533]RSM59802.1 hypothetical protein DMB66_26495 [Actinoplanes sp. ATCC 53533]
MRQALHSVSDRMLGLFLPKARAGACACFPSDSHYEYRCAGFTYQRRWCRYSCTCNKTCDAWVTIGNC